MEKHGKSLPIKRGFGAFEWVDRRLTNWEIVSVRSHARTRGLVVRSELGKKRLARGFSLDLLDSSPDDFRLFSISQTMNIATNV